MPGISRYYNWLVFRLIVKELERTLSEYARGDLLDIGCGTKPYASLVSRYVTSHVGVDHQATLHDKSRIDLFGTAYEIPSNSEEYDTILCTDVLEHLEEPERALWEAFRVLRPGGYAVYTVPLFWHTHEEPRDFYRFTRYGLQYLFEKTGFEIIRIVPLTGFCACFGQELCYFLCRFRHGGPLNPLWWLVPPVVLAIQAIAYLLNHIERTENFCMEYLVVARKPEKSESTRSLGRPESEK